MVAIYNSLIFSNKCKEHFLNYLFIQMLFSIIFMQNEGGSVILCLKVAAIFKEIL